MRALLESFEASFLKLAEVQHKLECDEGPLDKFLGIINISCKRLQERISQTSFFSMFFKAVFFLSPCRFTYIILAAQHSNTGPFMFPMFPPGSLRRSTSRKLQPVIRTLIIVRGIFSVFLFMCFVFGWFHIIFQITIWWLCLQYQLTWNH